MSTNLKTNFTRLTPHFGRVVKVTLFLILVLTFTACTTNLQSKVAGNLNQFSKQQTVAILPVEIIKKDQKETAEMLRQGLYAHLKESKFNLLERYVVDGLLKQHGLNNPADFLRINPMRFAEILGADAVLISRINRVERSYLIVHSSIEVGVSAQLVDTRTGEILWRAEQTEQDYQGIAKIPTGISSAILGPIRFVTNKLNLRRITSKLVNKLTAIVKNPEDAKQKETFEEPLIASSTARDLEKIQTVNDLKAEWVEDSAAYTKVPLPTKTQKNFQEGPALARQRFAPETREMNPKHINWVPRKMGLQPMVLESQVQTLGKPSIFTTTPANITSSQKSTGSEPLQYTIQVGAYKTEANASQMASNLLKKGYRTRITPDTKNGAPLFKVHVDKFSSKKQALKLTEKFATEENLPSFVTTTSLN
jgi:cell division septation protein DedD